MAGADRRGFALLARSINFSDVKLKRGILKAKEGVRADGKPVDCFVDDDDDEVDVMDIVAVVFDRATLLAFVLEEVVEGVGDDDDDGGDEDEDRFDDGGVMVLDLGMEVVVLDLVFVVVVVIFVVSVVISGEGGSVDV